MQIENRGTTSDIGFALKTTSEEFDLVEIDQLLRKNKAAIAIIETPNKNCLVWLAQNTTNFGSVPDYRGEAPNYGVFSVHEMSLQWNAKFNELILDVGDSYYIRISNSGRYLLSYEEAEAAVHTWKIWRDKIKQEKSNVYSLKILAWK